MLLSFALLFGVGLGLVLGLQGRRHPILMHSVAICLWVFTTPVLKAMSASYIATCLLVNPRRRDGGAGQCFQIWLAGGAVFVCRTLAIWLNNGTPETLIRDIGSGVPHCLLWAILVYNTIRSPEDCLAFLKVFALVRIFECGFFGIIGYFFPFEFVDLRLAYRALSEARDAEIQSLLFDQSRLIGFTIINSVDVSFHLAMSSMFLLACIGRKFSLLLFAAVGVALAAVVLTWSRTGLVCFTLILAYCVAFSKTRARWNIVVAMLVSVPLLSVGGNLIEERLFKDQRLTSVTTIQQRIESMSYWLAQIPEAGLFGVGTPDMDENQSTTEGNTISSENILIQTTIQTGLIGGASLLFLFAWSCYSLSSVILSTQFRFADRTKKMAAIGVSGGMFIGFLLANTFLVSYREPYFWLLFGCVGVLIQIFRVGYSPRTFVGGLNATAGKQIPLPV